MALRVDRYPNNAPRGPRPGEHRWPLGSARQVAEFHHAVAGSPFRTDTERIGEGTNGTLNRPDAELSWTKTIDRPVITGGRDPDSSVTLGRVAIHRHSRLISPGATAFPSVVRTIENTAGRERLVRHGRAISGGARTRCSARRTKASALPADTAGTLAHTPVGLRTGTRRQIRRPTGAVAEYSAARSGPMSGIWPQRPTAERVRRANGTIGRPFGTECSPRSDTRVDIDVRAIRRHDRPSTLDPRTRNKILFDPGRCGRQPSRMGHSGTTTTQSTSRSARSSWSYRRPSCPRRPPARVVALGVDTAGPPLFTMVFV
jgi:hypothetical protein